MLYLTRTWVFSIHRQKEILLGRWHQKATHATPEDKIKEVVKDNDFTDINDTSTDINIPDEQIAFVRDCVSKDNFTNNNIAGKTSYQTIEQPHTSTTDDLPVLPASVFDPAVHVQHSDLPPIVVPRPWNLN